MFSFQGASEFLSSRDSMKHLLFQSCFSQSLFLVEISGFEPLTSCLQGRRSPSWAKPPSLCVLTRSLYQLKAQRSGFQLERRSRFAREHFAFRRNAEFAKRTSTSWWAKMDSLSCGKATPVETVHRTVSKCRLSSPSQTLQSSLVGQNGLEPSTSRLSVVCSSQLSYWPIFGRFFLRRFIFPLYPLNWIT